MTRFAGKRVLVVGGASGIGLETALAFGREGAAVSIADLNEEGGNAARERLTDSGGTAWFFRADVRDESSVSHMVASAVEAMGGLDVLINCAGVLRVGLVNEVAIEDWNETFDVNVRGYFLTVKHSLEALRSGERATIVNIGSASGFKDGAGNTAYSASKGAVISFSRTLAMELAADGIRVNSVCPGFIDTPFNEPAYEFMGGQEAVDRFIEGGIPLRRMGRPEEVAHYVLFLCSAEAAFVTGQAVLMDGGMI